MKEKMKKVDFFLFHRDSDEILEQLQDQALFHINSEIKGENESLEEIQNKLKDYDSILSEIDNHHEYQESDREPDEIINHFKNLKKVVSELNECREKFQKDFRLLKPWGSIKWKRIDNIEKFNWTFSFYVAPLNSFLKVKDDPYVLEVSNHAGNVFFVNVKPRNGGEKMPFEELELPRMPLGEVGKNLNETEEKIAKINQEIFNLGRYYDLLQSHRTKLKDELNLAKVREGMKTEGDGKIRLIQAWFSKENEKQALAALDNLNIYYQVSDPDSSDDVPIKLKNNFYSKIFENITQVYQLPNYRELDLTPFIGVFYPIFFAYCLGDSGYGIVLLLLSFYALLGPLKKQKSVALLGITLGIFTTVVGILKSGTVFGASIAEVRNIPLFDSLSKYIFITDDQDFIFNAFNVSLMIGLFQILVGVLLSFYRKIKFQSFSMAIPMIAKFFIIVSSVSLFLGASQGMSIFQPHVGLSKILLLLGIGILLLTHDYSIPIFSRIMKGLLEVFFVFTGILGDSLSYIRLFALGVSSSILGLVVNQIGAPLLDGGIIAVIGGIVFLIFGHALNFAIAFLGALIHPLRLTFVEFYGNAQFEGGGKAFTTFKKHTQNINS